MEGRRLCLPLIGEGDMNIQKLVLFLGVFLSFLMLAQSSLAWEGSYYPTSYYTTQGLMGNRGHQNSAYNHEENKHYRPYFKKRHYVQNPLDYEYQHFYQHSYPVLGVVFSRPFGSRKIIFNETEYYYNSGTFYRRCGREYDVVEAPIGAYVRNLPHGYKTSLVGNRKYFYSQGTYFLRGSQGYQIVEDPYWDDY